MTKFLLIALALFVLYKLLMNDRTKKSSSEAKVRERKIATGEMVKDPICGTYVEREGSITVRDGSKVHCFCSYDCREKFLEKIGVSAKELGESSEEK